MKYHGKLFFELESKNVTMSPPYRKNAHIDFFKKNFPSYIFS